jgi:hypothetical protein
VIDMSFFRSRQGRLAFVFALLVGSACAMTTVAAYPSTPQDTMLGAEWKCWRLAWMTSCTRAPASEGARVTELGVRADLSLARKDTIPAWRGRAQS